MAPVTGAELAAVCGTADPGAVAGFVADLYEARGRTVERAPADVDVDAAASDVPAGRSGDGAGAASFVLGGTGGRQRVVVPSGGSVPADADAVVVAGRTTVVPDGTRVIDACRLRDALLYAVDRETADRLLERWFERSLSSFEGDSGTSGVENVDGPAAARPPDGTADLPGVDSAGTAASPGVDAAGTAGTDSLTPPEAGTAGGRRPAAFAVGALVVLAVAAAVVGLAVGLPPGFGPVGATGTTPEPALASESGSPTGTPVPGNGLETQGPGFSERLDTAPAPGPGRTASARLTQLPNFMSALPPGVDRNGIADYRRLVDATRDRLEGQSYRVTFVYRELVDGTTTAVSTQTVRVENGTHYRTSEMEFGQFASSPPRLVDRDAYADGTVRYERTADGVRRVPATPPDQFLDRLSQYLGWYLSVEESWVAGRETGRTTTTLRLASEGDPWPGVTNATGDAIVTDSGLVRLVRRGYDDPDSEVHVVVTIRVSDVGRTGVTRPAWVRDGSSG